MLRDSEVQEVCKIMLRLAKINVKLDKFYGYTEDAEKEHLAIAISFLNGAMGYLALIGGKHEMDK